MSTGFGPSPDRQPPGHEPAAQQPGYGASAYQPGYSAAAYEPGGGTGRNGAGRVSLAAGIVVVLIGLARQVVSYMLPTLMGTEAMSSYEVYRTFVFIGSGVTVAIGLVALIAGLVGLQGTGKPKGAAGAGCALGAWAVLSAIAGLALPFILVGGF